MPNAKYQMSNKKNRFRFIGYWILVIFVVFVVFPPVAGAFRMSNAFYIIILGNMNSIAGQAAGSGNILTFTSGELGAGLYSGTNYKLCAGFYGGIFCNATTLVSGLFTFTVTPTSLDFGTIDPTSPVTRTNILDVLSSASGYSVTAIENHSLKSVGGTVIPDTTCDSGVCTPSTAAQWSNNLTYGFGYRCDNVVATDCVSGFTTNYFKPFANSLLAQTPQVVMQNANSSAVEKQTQITYKVNVAGIQLPGVYTNTITYVASPNF
jgi:hypothetical protein